MNIRQSMFESVPSKRIVIIKPPVYHFGACCSLSTVLETVMR